MQVSLSDDDRKIHGEYGDVARWMKYEGNRQCLNMRSIRGDGLLNRYVAWLMMTEYTEDTAK